MNLKQDSLLERLGTKDSVKRILIIQLSSPSRLICASSLVHDLKQRDDVHVAVLVRPRWAEVAASIPGVDEVIRSRKNSPNIGLLETIRLGRLLRRKAFDVLICPDSTGNLALLAGLSGIKVRISYRTGLGRVFYNHRVDADKRQVCTQLRDQDLVKVLGVEPSVAKLRLKSPNRQEEYLGEFLLNNNLDADDKLVAFCLDSPWPTMRWPAVYYSSLAGSMMARGIKPVLLGQGSDRKFSMEINKSIGIKLPSFFSDELSKITSVLSKCSMAVGGDAGFAHMARALGVPTVMIFGPSDPRRFQFEDWTRVLSSRVKCRPCSYRGNKKCRERHHDCMRLVSPERVLDALREIADIQTPPPMSAQAGEGETSASDAVPLP